LFPLRRIHLHLGLSTAESTSSILCKNSYITTRTIVLKACTVRTSRMHAVTRFFDWRTGSLEAYKAVKPPRLFPATAHGLFTTSWIKSTTYSM
jgi:hypothetical protein